MVVVLYSSTVRDGARAYSCLSGSYDVVRASDWHEFLTVSKRATVSIIVVGLFSSDAVCRDLAALGNPILMRGIVLVAPKHADLLRRFSCIPVSEVVWSSNMERDLALAVERAGTDSYLHQLANALDVREGSFKSRRTTNRRTRYRSTSRFEDRGRLLSRRLSHALAIALRSRPPLRNVHHWAELAGCHERTLERHWRAFIGDSCPMRVEDVLGWILIIHAVRLKVPGRPWSEVASSLRVDQRTVWRWARRLLGFGLRELEVMEDGWILRRFANAMDISLPFDPTCRKLD